jgi:hypothetical protein
MGTRSMPGVTGGYETVCERLPITRATGERSCGTARGGTRRSSSVFKDLCDSREVPGADAPRSRSRLGLCHGCLPQRMRTHPQTTIARRSGG